MSRQPSPELARRAVAFDHVIEALRAVAALTDEDIATVFAGAERAHDLCIPNLVVARSGVRRALVALVPADRALNAELSALDDP